jgi:SAM-dependent methyltransferase
MSSQNSHTIFDRNAYTPKPMSWWERVIAPKLICKCCAMPQMMEKRALVVPKAEGDVLELGCGGGINMPLYDHSRVKSYAGLDPSPRLLDAARTAAQAKGIIADIRAGIGEAMPFANASFDSVVVTYTLCSVQDQMQALSEMRRVLRPGGKALFLEHGLSPDAKVEKWQRRIEPIWKPISGGCHLTRSVTGAYDASGFKLVSGGRGYMPETPRPLGWVEWGEGRV